MTGSLWGKNIWLHKTCKVSSWQHFFLKFEKRDPQGQVRLLEKLGFLLMVLFFRLRLCWLGSTGGYSWQHVSRTSKMWGTNFQKPDQGNRGGESCKGCLRAGKGGDLILVGSARLYLFEYIVYICINTLGSRGSMGFPYQVDRGCDAGTASLMRPLRHYLCGSRCVPGRKRVDGSSLIQNRKSLLLCIHCIHLWGFPKMVVPNNHGFSY